MKAVFVGGSRHVARLPAFVRERLDAIVEQRHRVLVGDANGADKAVQRHFADRSYGDVLVFCSGERPRNNVGDWPVEAIDAGGARGFQFYAAKDRAMARAADAGLMIWDGKSAGTLLNVLRLAQAGKKTVLATVPDRAVVTIRSDDTWRDLFSQLSPALRADLRDRATSGEWGFAAGGETLRLEMDAPQPADPIAAMNDALRIGDARGFLTVAAAMARTHDVAWSDGDEPDFATVLRRLGELGIGMRVAAGRR